MPSLLLTALLLTVGPYVLLMGIASVRCSVARRRSPPPPPSEWPSVSVLVDASSSSVDELLQSITACTYPKDQLEIILIHPAAPDPLPRLDEPVPVRHVEASDTGPNHFANALTAAEGTVLVGTVAPCTIPPKWIQSMVRHCSPETPIVLGPTQVEHNDLFLPRLHALQRFGEMTLALGFEQELPLSDPDTLNFAIRPESMDEHPADASALERVSPLLPEETDCHFNPEPEAALNCEGVSTFEDYLYRQARLLWRTARTSTALTQGIVAGIWLTHALLLATCLAAVAIPAWRQPALLVFLGKMVGDGLLAVPAARSHQQHGLVRSFVPSELLLVLTVPFTGLMGPLGLLSSPQS